MSYIIYIKVHDNISNKPYYFTPRNVYGVNISSVKEIDYFLLPPNTTKKNIHKIINEMFVNKIFKKSMPYKDIYKLNKKTNQNVKYTYVIDDVYWNEVLYKTSKLTGTSSLDEGIKDGSITAFEIRIDITTILPGAGIKDKLLNGCDYHKRVISNILMDMKINMNEKYFKKSQLGGRKSKNGHNKHKKKNRANKNKKNNTIRKRNKNKRRLFTRRKPIIHL